MTLEGNETRKQERLRPEQVASLLIVEGDRARTLELEEEVVFGRMPECTVPLIDDSVSRRHARILRNGDAWELYDLGSQNGTFVNQRRIDEPARLRPGDVVTIGAATIVVQGLGAPAKFERAVPWSRFTASVDEALALALRTGAPISVASFQLTAPSAKANLMLQALTQGLEAGDLATSASSTDFAVLFGDGADPFTAADRALQALSQFDPSARGAVARFPRDGTRADVLLLAAREAARLTEPGQLTEHGEASELTLGDRRLVIADPGTRSVFALLTRLAASPVSVLVTGETGVGKENAAFALHHHSKRQSGPFVTLNCAALQDTLAESELFGHERGAFTGASATRVGAFEAAHQGTLFLDEVGELSAAVQAKLLRALESRSITRVGATKPIEVDVRVVAATHRNLEEDVAAGRFRKDLFFRLAAAVVTLPALRARPVELAVLARRFLEQACERQGRDPMQLSADAMDALQRYAWPGNVRELKNTIEVVVAATPALVVERGHLPSRISGAQEAPSVGPAVARAQKPLSQELAELETQRILEALVATHHSQTEAAERLGMPRRTLVFKLRRLRAQGLLPPER